MQECIHIIIITHKMMMLLKSTPRSENFLIGDIFFTAHIHFILVIYKLTSIYNFLNETINTSEKKLTFACFVSSEKIRIIVGSFLKKPSFKSSILPESPLLLKIW